MGTLRKSFDELPLHIRDGITAGLFSGSFEVENGSITSVTLDGSRWGHNESGRYVQLPVLVDLDPGHLLWAPICESLGEIYIDEIEATDPIASQGDDEHRHGKFEATGRR